MDLKSYCKQHLPPQGSYELLKIILLLLKKCNFPPSHLITRIPRPFFTFPHFSLVFSGLLYNLLHHGLLYCYFYLQLCLWFWESGFPFCRFPFSLYSPCLFLKSVFNFSMMRKTLFGPKEKKIGVGCVGMHIVGCSLFGSFRISNLLPPKKVLLGVLINSSFFLNFLLDGKA